MKCSECGRELKEDSKFCDYCGSLVANKADISTQLVFNKSALFSGILFSVLITLLMTGLAGAFGIPLLFGGLFLPFFFMRKKKNQ